VRVRRTITRKDIAGVMLSNMDSNGNLERAQERSNRHCLSARYELSGAQSSYIVADEPPRHSSKDTGYSYMNNTRLQETQSLPITNTFNGISSSYVASSDHYHGDSPFSSHIWSDNSEYEPNGIDNGTTTYNTEAMSNQRSSSVYSRGGYTLQSGGSPDMERKTRFADFRSNRGWGRVAMPPEASQPLEDTSDLGSVEMERQPANLGCGPPPAQGQDLVDQDWYEAITVGHDLTPYYGLGNSNVEPRSPPDRGDTNVENDWLLSSLPRLAFEWVFCPWNRTLGFISDKLMTYSWKSSYWLNAREFL